MEYSKYKDANVLVGMPNYTNVVTAETHQNHMECAIHWTRIGLNFNMMIVGRTFVHFARTQICNVLMQGEFTHLFWIDDDAVVDPDILPRFIEHDKDIVIAPYPMRKSPFEIGILSSTTGDFHDHASYENLSMKDMDQGLIEVDGGGTHCMLVKREVFTMRGQNNINSFSYPSDLAALIESLNADQRKVIDDNVGNVPDESVTIEEENDKLNKPYFMMPKSGTEDMYFCYRAKKKGAKIWCDTDVFAGHVGFAPVVTKSFTQRAEEADYGKRVFNKVELLKSEQGRNFDTVYTQKGVNLA